MHVLYLNTEDLSRDVASGRVHFWAVAKGMADLGCQVTIVAPRYRYATWKVPAPLGSSLLAVPFKNSVSLFLFELRLLFAIPWLILRHHPQVLLVRGGGPGWIPGLLFLAFRMGGVRVVLECNGITWQEFAERGFSRRVVAIVRVSAWQQARTCNRIIAVTREIGEAYCGLAKRDTHIMVEIPNGVDPAEFQFSPKERIAARDRLGIPHHHCLAGYVGSFSVWHGIPEILAAAKILQERGQEFIQILLVGGEEFEAARHEIETRPLRNIRLLGSARNREELHTWIASFDIGLCTNYPIHGSPLKFFEYLACGIPIVASGSPQMVRLVESECSGIAMAIPTGAAIADAIERMASDLDHWRDVGRHNRILAEQTHSWRQVAARVLTVLRS